MDLESKPFGATVLKGQDEEDDDGDKDDGDDDSDEQGRRKLLEVMALFKA